MNSFVKKPGVAVHTGAQKPAATIEASGNSPMPARYLATLVASLLACFAAYYLVLLALSGTGNLPPPALANNLCVDEKLSFLREHPPATPNLLVIGSSVAWRHIDSSIIAKGSPGTRPLNGAFCGLRADQSAYVADWLLGHYPGVKQVLMVVSPQDFAGCRAQPDAVFDRRDADRYVYDGVGSWWFYLRYFSPKSLGRSALAVKGLRADVHGLNTLTFNRYGDGPLDTKMTSETLVYDQPDALDPACFSALKQLATRLENTGRQLLVVATPLNPAWKAKEDPQGVFLGDFDRRLADALESPNATYWNADREWQRPDASFTDAIHLRWSAAQELSKEVAQRFPPAAP